MKWALAAAALLAAAPAGSAAAAGLVAEQIGAADVAERQIGGPDAIGGIGDWYLANDLVEIVVDDPGRRHGKLDHGGTIVDAGVRGRDGDDQFARLFPILNLDQRVLLGYDTMRAEVDPSGRFARLVVSGSRGLDSVARPGLLGSFSLLVPEAAAIAKVLPETAYEVRPGEPFVRITTRLRNTGASPAPIFSYGDVWMRGGRSMRSFLGDTLAPERSPGFHHRSFDRHDMLSSGGAMEPFTFVAMPGVEGLPPITYAIFSPERTQRGLWSFGVTGQHVNLVDAFTSDPPWEKLGLWRMLRVTRAELAPGQEWVYERRLLVVEGGDVAAATDRIFPLLGVADGASGVEVRVEPPDVRTSILVQRAEDGAPVTQLATRAASGGAARALLPPGDYRLELRAPLRPTQQVELRVPAGGFAAQAFALPPVGELRFQPAFADGGPGRIVFEGLGDTPDPVFGAELLDFRIDGRKPSSGSEVAQLFFLGNEHDPERVAIAPGRYRLTATRGPLYTIAQQELEVPAGSGPVRVPPFQLRRVVELDGVVSADFHVHSQASDDSQTPNIQRLSAFVAEGVDVMVSTDHDHVADYGPALEATGAGDRIRVRVGVEVTSSAPLHSAPWTLGHHNAWPVAHRPEQHRQGAPPSQVASVAELYALLRADYGVGVVQLNHALKGEGTEAEEAFLSHLGSAGRPYDPSRPIDSDPNRLLLEPASDGHTRAIDFDAMEIMNGHKWQQYLALREAWYSLLRQGFRRTATSNSDTHGPDQEAGYPRNYVYVGRADWDDAAFDAAVREGRSFTSTGPLIAGFRVGAGRMGDLVAAPGGEVVARFSVAAAPWIPVDEVRLLVNGEVLRRYRDLAPDGEVLRLSRSETLHFSRDAFVTLEAGAALDVDEAQWRRERGGIYSGLVARGFVSQAVSNPIFVDADGDGRFQPPGLGAPPGRAARSRLVWISGLIGLLAVLWWWLRRRSGLSGMSPRL